MERQVALEVADPDGWLDLAAVLEGGMEADLEKAWCEFPHASRIIVLTKGLGKVPRMICSP
jgi:hypothetical protein